MFPFILEQAKLMTPLIDAELEKIDRYVKKTALHLVVLRMLGYTKRQ